MQMMEPTHSFMLNGRSHAEITGVSDVDCFNEDFVVLNTSLGAMTISGRALNILQFNQSDGRLIINGEFDAVEYSGKAQPGKGGLLARIFR